MSGSSTNFLLQFLRNPSQTGAVLPSSGYLAEAVVDWLDLGAARSVLEYGPGTGSFTPHILKRVGMDCRFLAIERNATLAEEFRRKLPDVELIQD